MQTVDAVVVGAGHHGLVTAALLADAGWDVLVVEERDEVGGAVASRVDGDWVEDEFSACHPLALASPVLRDLGLEHHGLEWAHAPRPLAHLAGRDRDGIALHADPLDTAADLDRGHPGDGAAWLEMVEQWQRVREPLIRALLTRWPPVADAARLVARIGLREAPDLARMALLPVHQLAREHFGGAGAAQLLAGNAMHADIPPTAPGSGLYGWLMTMLCQDVGFPSPRGGTRQLARALRLRAEAAGARVETGGRRRAGRRGRWARARCGAVRRAARAGASCGRGRHERAAPLRGPARPGRRPGRAAPTTGALRLGPADAQAQPAPRRAGALDRAAGAGRRGAPRRPRRARPHPLVGGARGGRGAGGSLRPRRADEHDRPLALAGGHRGAVALHAPAAAPARRCRGGGRDRRGLRAAARVARPGVVAARGRAVGADPGRSRGGRCQPRRGCGGRRHAAALPAGAVATRHRSRWAAHPRRRALPRQRGDPPRRRCARRLRPPRGARGAAGRPLVGSTARPGPHGRAAMAPRRAALTSPAAPQSVGRSTDIRWAARVSTT
ncbi:FAD dependent oxidoreductase [Janibacter hoylei PVAS-1]|uniref:FAD dependent oxidoreductase n=1 Tax=Janibacter hoylei PVAS-1 TaxID=1210046 RepID=K1E310_9MICO|nr:FAD dependent oxidoreductase [Janibacter hoylei PVAS-1]